MRQNSLVLSNVTSSKINIFVPSLIQSSRTFKQIYIGPPHLNRVYKAQLGNWTHLNKHKNPILNKLTTFQFNSLRNLAPPVYGPLQQSMAPPFYVILPNFEISEEQVKINYNEANKNGNSDYIM